jgi:hypothetical protein
MPVHLQAEGQSRFPKKTINPDCLKLSKILTYKKSRQNNYPTAKFMKLGISFIRHTPKITIFYNLLLSTNFNGCLTCLTAGAPSGTILNI